VRGEPRDGTGAGGGRAVGLVEHGARPTPGSVLVVDTLDPRLAPVLTGLAGLVAATGSPLSHLAILAREHGVATVVGVEDALRRFPPGSEVLVDGSSGEVSLLSPAPEVVRP
jgi:phosphohistidine swiveling domain-containing protein